MQLLLADVSQDIHIAVLKLRLPPSVENRNLLNGLFFVATTTYFMQLFNADPGVIGESSWDGHLDCLWALFNFIYKCVLYQVCSILYQNTRTEASSICSCHFTGNKKSTHSVFELHHACMHGNLLVVGSLVGGNPCHYDFRLSLLRRHGEVFVSSLFMPVHQLQWCNCEWMMWVFVLDCCCQIVKL